MRLPAVSLSILPFLYQYCHPALRAAAFILAVAGRKVWEVTRFSIPFLFKEAPDEKFISQFAKDSCRAFFGSAATSCLFDCGEPGRSASFVRWRLFADQFGLRYSGYGGYV